MYGQYHEFSRRPFSLVPDPNFLYIGDRHSTTYSLLEYSVKENTGICVIVGAVGNGKTTLVNHFIGSARDHFNVSIISNTHRMFDDLFLRMLDAFSIDRDDLDRPRIYDLLCKHLEEKQSAGVRSILLVDEAQNILYGDFELIRILGDFLKEGERLLEVVLFGQLQLRHLLMQAEAQQFSQRVSVGCYLDTLTLYDVPYYIKHRLETAGSDLSLLTPSAICDIAGYSNAIPRVTSQLCDLVLLYAFVDQKHVIDLTVIRQVMEDRKVNLILPVTTVTHVESYAVRAPRSECPKHDFIPVS